MRQKEECPKVGVLSISHKELDGLSAELCKRGALDLYVRRFVCKGRKWEKLLAKTPGLKGGFSSTFSRRPLPPGIAREKVKDVAILYDFLWAAAVRLPVNSATARLTKALIHRRNIVTSIEGSKLFANAESVVSNYSIAAPTFRKIKARGGRAILNYPNAHHRYITTLLANEAEREPEWANTISDDIAKLSSTLDAEIQLADMVLVGSQFVQRTFISEGVSDKQIVAVPYGCDTKRFSPSKEAARKGRFRAIFVGQLTQRKGISYLLQGYKQFMAADTELAIAGSMVAETKAFDQYRNTISYLGNLPPSELSRAYQKSDVFVLPTLAEGMPLVILEAMASGLPVITTDQGPGEIVRDGIDGFIIPIRDPRAIAEKLELLRANPELRAEMGLAARKRALQFTWESYAQKAADAVLACASE